MEVVEEVARENAVALIENLVAMLHNILCPVCQVVGLARQPVQRLVIFFCLVFFTLGRLCLIMQFGGPLVQQAYMCSCG